MNSQRHPVQTLCRRIARLRFARWAAWFRVVVSTVLLGTALTAATASAQPGVIDTTFGPYGTGAGLSHAHYYKFRALDGLVLPDDRIVVFGACPSIPNVSTVTGTLFCIATWSADGTSGTIYVFESGTARVTSTALGAIARQPDGKLVLTAPCKTSDTAQSSLCVMRVNANFTQDMSFASNWPDRVAKTSYFTSASYANAVAVQPDGKIVIAGQCGIATGTVMCAARYLANGANDMAFGGGSDNLRTFAGVATSPFDRAKSIVVHPDGKLVFGGDCKDPNAFYYPCAGRLNADGSIDTAFNSGASKPRMLPGIGAGDDYIDDMKVQANGQFVWAGHCNNSSSTMRVPCALRVNLTPTGLADGSRYDGATVPSGNTILEPDAGGSFRIDRILMQADGKMLAMMRDEVVQQGLTGRVSRIRRYNEDGSIDANWAQPQIVWQYNWGVAAAIAQQSNSKLIVMGYTEDTVRIFRLDNLPSAGSSCSMDVDGDGVVSPTTDGLLIARAAAGMTGTAVTNGAIGPNALRNTWAKVRDHLMMQCGMTTLKP